MNRTWIVVADAGVARIFIVDKPGSKWRLHQTFDNPAGRAHGRDFLEKEDGAIQHKEGSVFRSGMEPLSMKKVESQRFAHAIGLTLHRASATHEFERLVLVAAPEFLGILRKELSKEVEAKLIDSIPRDFGRLGATELESAVGITHLD